MKSVLDWIEGVYLWLCGSKLQIKNKTGDVETFVKKWSRIFGVICVILIDLAAIAVFFHSEWMIIVLSILSSLMFLTVWYSGDTFASSLKITPVATEIVGKVADELKGLIFPICTLSLILAFLAFWVGVNGIEALYTRQFLVIFLTVFFGFVAMIYFGDKTKYVGKILSAAVVIMLLFWAFPEQYRWINRAVYSTSAYAGSVTDRYSLNRQADAVATYAVVREDSILYSNGIATEVSVKADQTVMVVKVKNDLITKKEDETPSTGLSEPMVKIVLQDGSGNFVNPNGIVYEIPRSKLGKYMVASDIYADADQIPPRDVNWMIAKVETKKTDLLRVYDGDTFYYYSDKGFWAEYENGHKYFNNPSYDGQMMRFIITSTKKEGEIVKVWSDKPLQIKYKVESQK